MDNLQDDMIVIPLKGLTQGGHSFSFTIDGEFFHSFGNVQIKEADCSVRLDVVRHQTLMEVSCMVGGYVVVECDRCLEDLTLKVDVVRPLTVGFGAVDLDDSDEDVLVVDSSQGNVSLDQFVYDYVCLSLPMIKVHPEGKCNPDMIRRMSVGDAGENENSDKNEGNTPFGSLKDIIESKNN